ncbi:MAG: DnaJ domain-containing protein [Acidobacteriota bacterium]|nr:DnaJ domain-containing protein [Acidobacteriota bacterium]
MASYYKVLKVSPKASNAEIKSAYRRLARKFHPDVNGGAETASLEFAKIAKAYEILGNPQTRAEYDKKLLKEQFNHAGESVFDSENQHAKRWRQMAYERRYNEIIDRMIADERRETLALQKVIFPLVALFVSTCFVAVFKPMIWANSRIIGKTILFGLFAVGVVHLYRRLRVAFERYTYKDENIHDSIFQETETVTKPFTRVSAVCFLVVGFFLSFGIGLFIGNYLDVFAVHSMPSIFSSNLRPEFIFYPPIFVLIVDLMHAFATRMDY